MIHEIRPEENNYSLDMPIILAQAPEVLIEGESLRQGSCCTFIRFTKCNLRCHSTKYPDCHCDSEYTFTDNEPNVIITTIGEVLKTIHNLKCKNVSFTGGEPLLHPNELHNLLHHLENDYDITIETNGSLDFGWIIEDHPSVHIIGDWKMPYAFGEKTNEAMYEDNIEKYRYTDALKFVVTREDLKLVEEFLEKYQSSLKAQVYISPCWGVITFKEVADWVIKNNSRFNNLHMSIQQHKLLMASEEDIKSISEKAIDNIHL